EIRVRAGPAHAIDDQHSGLTRERAPVLLDPRRFVEADELGLEPGGIQTVHQLYQLALGAGRARVQMVDDEGHLDPARRGRTPAYRFERMCRRDAGKAEILQQAPQSALRLVEIHVVPEPVEPRDLYARLPRIELPRVHVECHRFVAPVEALEDPPEVPVRE